MSRQQIARIDFFRISIALSVCLIAVCAYAPWPGGGPTEIAQPEFGIEQPTLIVSPTSTPDPTISPTPNSLIRSIDFKNFTYPEIGARGTFTLKDGHELNVVEPRGIVDVIYGDLTSDGLEDVMVVQSQSVRGSAIPYFVYVYSMNGIKVRLLWSFYAGDRGDGGLRQITANGGRMVLELYGRDRTVNGGSSSEADNLGLCCPPFFTRSCYEWHGGRFRLKTKEAQLPNPQGNAAYLPLFEGLDTRAGSNQGPLS